MESVETNYGKYKTKQQMVGDKKLNIKIITTAPFPVGMAGTSRIMSYAKGLTENDCNITVISMKTTENPTRVFNKSTSGVINGITFRYATKKTIISSNILQRRIDDLRGLFYTCLDLLKEKKKNKTDAVIFYSFSLPRAILIYLVTRIKRIQFLVEESELPSVYIPNTPQIIQHYYIKLYYKLFDGLLLMTKRLITYFLIEQKLNKPIIHVPMTVDVNRFNIPKSQSLDVAYIAYCGILNNKKDGVDILLKAYIKLAKEFTDICLYLIGNAINKEEESSYKEIVCQNKLEKRVIFTGLVNREKIPELLVNASILVLPRPLSLQAEGGFPTKLGEYLATGNPVVVTRVGEIPEYLMDRETAFIAEPGSVESLYNKIKEILLNYPNAMNIGQNGKRVALKSFNYQIQALKTIDFIEKIKENKK